MSNIFLDPQPSKSIFDQKAAPVQPTQKPIQPTAGFDETPLGYVTNFIKATPDSVKKVGTSLIQSLFRIPADFGVSAAQAGTALSDRFFGTDSATNAMEKQIPTGNLANFLGDEPIEGYAKQIENLSNVIKSSAFAKQLGLDKHSMPLAFAGIVGGEALNFIGGEENAIEQIAKEKVPEAIRTLLIKSGVNESVASKAAPHLAATSDKAEIKATLDTLRGVQNTLTHSAEAEVQQPLEMPDEGTGIPARNAGRTQEDIQKIVTDLSDKSGGKVKRATDLLADQEADGSSTGNPFIKREFQADSGSDLPVAAETIDSGEPIVSEPGKVTLNTSPFSSFKNSTAISDYISTIRKEAQALKPAFEKAVEDATGLKPDVNIKGVDSLTEKINSEVSKERNPDEIRDVLRGRIVVPPSEVDSTLAKIKEHFPINEDRSGNFFERPSKLGYRGHNLAIEFPDGRMIELQIHTPASKELDSLLHPIYEKWRRKPDASLTPEQLKEKDSDVAKAKAVADEMMQSEKDGNFVPKKDLLSLKSGSETKPKITIDDKIPLPPSVGEILANGKKYPIERTPSSAIENLTQGKDGKSWESLVKGYMYNAAPGKRAHIFDYLATPEFVLEKVGLGKGAEMLQDAKDAYRTTLKDEFDKLKTWRDKVPDPHASELIFKWLDGQQKDVTHLMSPEELKVASDIKKYLKDWATRLKLPEDQQISHYITHVFERTSEATGASVFDDPELAAMMKEMPAKSVYDPFLQKRFGKKGYIEDVWRALDAYTKRAARKEAMDPALEQLAQDAKRLDDRTYNYITTLSHRINMRPTELEQAMDSFITQTPIRHRFTDRPTAFISRSIRKLFYRGTLGLNFSSALRNLTQGVNTYSKLGEKYTTIGYAKLLTRMASGNLDELFKQGILDDGLIQDRNISVAKKMGIATDEVLFSLFQQAEKINRGSAYFGAKSQALAKGLSEEQAIKYAKRMVRETQFAFGAVDTPVALNDDVVKTLTQLQSYNIKQGEFLGRMAKQKDVAGLIRWTAGSIAMLGTIGKLIGMTPEQLIPSIGLGGSPTVSTLLAIPQLFSSNEQTKAAAQSQLQRNLASILPAGAQGRKTIQGLEAFNNGKQTSAKGKFQYRVAQTPPELLRALLFGKTNLPEAQQYYDSLGKKKATTKIGGGNMFD